MYKLIALSLLCAVFMAVSARAQTRDTLIPRQGTQRNGSIDGTVIDQQTKEPLPGCAVVLLAIVRYADNDTIVEPAKETLTDGDGRFRFANVPEGEYVAEVRHSGWITNRAYFARERTNAFATISLQWAEVMYWDPIVAQPPMIDPAQTGTVRRLTGDEIRKIPVR